MSPYERLRKAISIIIVLLLVYTVAYGEPANLPEVTMDDLGYVDGRFNVTGEAVFPTSEGGVIRYCLNKKYKGSAGFRQTSAKISLTSVMRDQNVHSGLFSQGEHTVRVNVEAAEGGTVTKTATFHIDNTPELELDPIGPAFEPFDIRGSALFKPYEGFYGSGYFYIDGVRVGHRVSYFRPDPEISIQYVNGA